VFTVGQPLVIDYNSTILKFVVQSCLPIDLGEGAKPAPVQVGMFGTQTELEFRQGPSGKLHVLSNKMQQRNIFTPDFNFEDLGIGGLNKEFGDIFRRAFAARVFPPHVIRDLGINHVRGMLLYGPPGCGKTLIARQLAKFLKAAEPKIVNGPEILSKYVGASEENIRKLFEDAEKEQKQMGENSQLHIIIFDEIDAICKQRGSSKDSTGVGDTVVNQLLTKIDGVDALNNILLIGMTNRLDMIDEAICRPGRLEVKVEIQLPDEAGRLEILNIHTKKMREKKYLSPEVKLDRLAARTKNFSGAEIEGFVKAAASYALNRKVDFKDPANTKDMADITVTPDDFELAFNDIKPAFGQKQDEFDHCIRQGIVQYSSEFVEILSSCQSLVNQVRTSSNTPLLTVLLEGCPGCGKTALAAHIATTSGFPFVRRLGAETYVGYSEFDKVKEINKVFDDAYKSETAVIVLDDIERLLDYVRIGPRFSNFVLQALFSLLKKVPTKANRRLLVIGTTSDKEFLNDAELLQAFNVALTVPTLCATEHFKAVLKNLDGFEPAVCEEIATSMLGKSLPIQRFFTVAEMAVQRQKPVTKAVFEDCLKYAGGR
jgi:vesicle-fusing ATPase